MIPLSLQRRVEGLLQEHLDRSQLSLDQICNDTEDRIVSGHPEGGIFDNREGSLVDRSIMEKILQRTSLRMRNLQRTWQVQLTTYYCILEDLSDHCHVLVFFHGFWILDVFSNNSTLFIKCFSWVKSEMLSNLLSLYIHCRIIKLKLFYTLST